MSPSMNQTFSSLNTFLASFKISRRLLVKDSVIEYLGPEVDLISALCLNMVFFTVLHKNLIEFFSFLDGNV